MFNIEYNKLVIFKNAFKKCKKCKSKLKKDTFDTIFLDPLVKDYNNILKGKTDVEIEKFKQFFENSIKYSEKWLLDKNKSKFYISARIDATNELKSASQKIVESIMDKSPFTAPKSLNTIGGILVKSGYKLKCLAIVLDIPYTGTNFTSLRCYICISGTSIIGKIINSDFDFANYEFEGHNYNDASISSRSIYKVASVPIKLPVSSITGTIDIQVYVSPNDWISKKAMDLVSMEKELLQPSDLN